MPKIILKQERTRGSQSATGLPNSMTPIHLPPPLIAVISRCSNVQCNFGPEKKPTDSNSYTVNQVASPCQTGKKAIKTQQGSCTMARLVKLTIRWCVLYRLP